MQEQATVPKLHQQYYHTLESSRLLLRPLQMKDDMEMFSYTSREETFRFLRGEPHRTIEQTRAFLCDAIAKCNDHSNFIWGICDRSTGRLIGTCRLFNISLVDRACEISYMIHPDYQRKGIATEAIERMIQYAFDELDLIRVQAHCVIHNFGSERVMQKSGMQQEGVLRKNACIHGRFEDYKLYAIIKGEK